MTPIHVGGQPPVGAATERAKRARRMRGFSLIELLIVVVIVMIVAGITFMSVTSALKQVRVDNAYRMTISAMDTARARATTMRRIYAVTFTLPGTITVTDAQDVTVPPILTASLPFDVSFDAENGIPAITATAPDRLGNGQPDGPICFDIGVTVNCSNTFLFFPDGSARDAAGNVNNGVIYIARAGGLMTSRAITLFGLSGRIRGWRLSKTVAGSTIYWRQQ